jgi:hypothetical protein
MESPDFEPRGRRKLNSKEINDFGGISACSGELAGSKYKLCKDWLGTQQQQEQEESQKSDEGKRDERSERELGKTNRLQWQHWQR